MAENAIARLTDYCRRNNLTFAYNDIGVEGPPHDPVFTTRVSINNRKYDPATGKSKKEARGRAAELAWEAIEQELQTERSATSSNDYRDLPFSNSQDASDATEWFVQKVNGFTSETSDSVIFQHSGASPNATDSGLECRSPVDRLGDALIAVNLNETSSLVQYEHCFIPVTLSSLCLCINFAINVSRASPKGPVIKPKRKETPLAPKFSNLCRKESKYTVNERFLEDYEDIEYIGFGGFGNVFKAKHVIDGSIRAIKRVELSCEEEEETKKETKGENAEREVQVLAKLEHENIVRYYTCWIGKDSVPLEGSRISDDSLRKICKCLFIEMEFCENRTLRKWISEKRSAQSQEDYLNKFLQIVEGVQYIHSQNIIHRDLKPENILLSRENKIKIGDFGLATSGIDYVFDARTENRGTKSYMAPEQVGSMYGKEVDIFPLGLIFFEMIYVFQTEQERSKEWNNIRDRKFPEAFVRKYPKEVYYCAYFSMIILSVCIVMLCLFLDILFLFFYRNQ
ncbi:hypothetical protein lerEdw1_006330 [Lerista edwardsae]|nr:hypothetical protein lerEdw1_006330 [Lerista edwardsae]